jgi:hypothetical protein
MAVQKQMKEFGSFLDCSNHITKLIETTILAEHEGLERAAKLVERQAKQEIGHYQDQAGPFVAWAELADATKADRTRLGYTENDPGLRDGTMRDSIEHVTGTHEAEIGSNDEHLVFFELGTEKQAPRSVLGTAAVLTGEKAAEIVGEGVAFALMGKGVVGGRLEIEE